MYVEKIKSGIYRCKVSLGKDINGKYRYKSFSATSKKQAELLALEYVKSGYKEEVKNKKTVSLKNAMAEYNISKNNIFSPSSLSEYNRMSKRCFTEYLDKDIYSLSNRDIQNWLSNYSIGRSAKTVKNTYAYLCSVLSYFDLPKPIVSLPQKEKIDYHIVTDEELSILLKYTKEHDYILFISIILAYSIPSRRGEICALSEKDFDRINCTVTINKDMVYNSMGKAQISTPKTFYSYRTVKLDSRIMNLIPYNIQFYEPNELERHWQKAKNALGIKFRFHDLRHYGCTTLLNNNVPIKAVQYVGGWGSAKTVLNIYAHCTEDSLDVVTNVMRQKLTQLL